MRPLRSLVLALSLGMAAMAPASAQTLDPTPTEPSSPSARTAAPATALTTPPLTGITIAIDPGHQLGNHNYPSKINQQVPAGGFTKPCNSVGTSTNGGVPEATVVFKISRLVAARLRYLGATVVLTRTTNREDRWGPCVDYRGKFGKAHHARLTLSIHADGAPSSLYGFHVIAPKYRSPWTSDIAAASLRLAKAVRAGMDGRKIARSTYIGSGTALSIRSDLGTLNMSDVPVAMVEIGNMRNASDARRMTSTTGRSTYAAALVSGIRRFVGR